MDSHRPRQISQSDCEISSNCGKKCCCTRLDLASPSELSFSNFNRIFEKLMYSKMISFIEEKELLYQAQYGFRKSHSTQHAILDSINTIQTNMDKRLFSCGIFIDLKKAFDTVNHGILLNKLEHYGFRGIINDWFSSHLNNQTQTTELKCHISNKAAITYGVPQGRVCLGTAPFSIIRKRHTVLFGQIQFLPLC